MAEVTDREYERLLAVRTHLRQFERWSAEQASAFGLTAGQHQLLLAIRGHADDAGPTVGAVADYLVIRHHTAVELVDRTQQLGLVTRERDAQDHRAVRLRLTEEGHRRVAALAVLHLEELSRVSQMIDSLLADLGRRPARG